MTTRPTAVQFRDDLVRLALEAFDATQRGGIDRAAFALHVRERMSQAAQVYEVYAALNETARSDEDVVSYAAWVAYCVANSGHFEDQPETMRRVRSALDLNPLRPDIIALGRTITSAEGA